MSQEWVSVVMPVRGAASWIESAGRSILDQTCQHWELIAIDDGSRDGGPDLLRQLFGGDDRLRVTANPGRGIVNALNHGLALARHPVVVRMDADDVMRPRRIERQVEALRKDSSLGVVGCRVESTGAKPTDGWREYIDWQNGVVTREDVATEIYVESPFAHPSVAFRRGTILTAGGYRDGDFPEDYELWLRLRARGVAMEKVPEVLLEWRDRPRRATRTDPRYSREAFDVLRAVYLARDDRLDGREVAIWGAGRVTRKRARHFVERRGEPVAWIDIDPRKTGKQLRGVPVVAPDWLRDRNPRPFVLVFIARHGARELVGAELEGLGYRKGHDWLAVG